jgi:hypothetical protein
MAALVDQRGKGGDVGVDLGLERRGQHPAGALASQLVQAHRQLTPGSLVCDYTQHAAFLPRRRWLAGVLPIWSGWKVRRVLMPGAHPQISTISPEGRAPAPAIGEQLCLCLSESVTVTLLNPTDPPHHH